MRNLKMAASLALAAAAVLGSTPAFADNSSPIGLWKTIDDDTGKPAALVRISEVNGTLQGQIEKLFREPNEDQNPKCEKCEDARKDKPITGMVIMTGLKKDGDEYAGGQILDPKNGSVYHSKITLTDGGKKLKMRGYIGVPMIGRTQIWIREQ